KLWQRHRTEAVCTAAIVALIVGLATVALTQASRIAQQHHDVLEAERSEHAARIAAEREGQRALAADRRARESLALAMQAQRDAEGEAASIEEILSFGYLNGIARMLNGPGMTPEELQQVREARGR